jgi:protein-disulfide isomerase
MHIRTQGFRPFYQRMLRTLLACVTVSFLSAAAAIAQQSSSSQKQSEEVVTLKNDVQQLKTQQQLILDRLDELKKLLSSKRGDNPQLAIKVPDTVGVDGERFRGEVTATVAIIEYGDIECPFCRRFKQDIYPRIVDDYIKTGKARFYYRDMPLTFHEHALPAARAEHCAGEQGKFWEMHDSLFIDKPGTIGPGGRKTMLTQSDIDDRGRTLGIDTAKLDECIASTRYADLIRRSAEEAAKMNIGGTPAFLIGTIGPNGNIIGVKPLVGAQPFEVFKSMIDPLLPAAPPEPHASRPAPDGATVPAAGKR